MRDRKTLKTLFQKGSMPSEESFADVIDSTINKIDDGFSKSLEDGLMLSPIGKSNKVLSIFKKITNKVADWSFSLQTKEEKEDVLHIQNKNQEIPSMTFTEKGNVGIQTITPNTALDVNGFVSSKGRVGNLTEVSTVPADGSWHTILDELNHCTAFEIMARTGVYHTGIHVVMHAIALSSYGNSFARIRKTNAMYSFWKPIRIRLRWVGTTYDYKLQMKTTRNLGVNTVIKYHITQLWDDEIMGDESHYTNSKTS